MSDFLSPDTNEAISLKAYAEKAYLDYSMYVILDRALPNIGDGLKTCTASYCICHERTGLKSQCQIQKIGPYRRWCDWFHPHGDSAAYEAMVLMAQPFSYRYPLVDGQGNWDRPTTQIICGYALYRVPADGL